MVSLFEKQLFDQFIKIKEHMTGESEDEHFVFSPFQAKDQNPDYHSLKNFDRDLGRLLKIEHQFNSTAYRKRLSIGFCLPLFQLHWRIV